VIFSFLSGGSGLLTRSQRPAKGTASSDSSCSAWCRQCGDMTRLDCCLPRGATAMSRPPFDCSTRVLVVFESRLPCAASAHAAAVGHQAARADLIRSALAGTSSGCKHRVVPRRRRKHRRRGAKPSRLRRRQPGLRLPLSDRSRPSWRPPSANSRSVAAYRSTPFRVTSLWRPVRTASGDVIDGERALAMPRPFRVHFVRVARLRPITAAHSGPVNLQGFRARSLAPVNAREARELPW
jgi:hypothetical protein